MSGKFCQKHTSWPRQFWQVFSSETDKWSEAVNWMQLASSLGKNQWLWSGSPANNLYTAARKLNYHFSHLPLQLRLFNCLISKDTNRLEKNIENILKLSGQKCIVWVLADISKWILIWNDLPTWQWNAVIHKMISKGYVLWTLMKNLNTC